MGNLETVRMGEILVVRPRMMVVEAAILSYLGDTLDTEGEAKKY